VYPAPHYYIDDIDSSSNEEGVNRVINQLKLPSNNVGESAADCQGIYYYVLYTKITIIYAVYPKWPILFPYSKYFLITQSIWSCTDPCNVYNI
jgi:hypothetical protein